jgi:iron complex outermembrane receptor protein
MSKLFLYFLLFFFFSGQSFSQEKILVNDKTNLNVTITKATFTGKVTDAKTGEPLPGASISLADLKLGTAADATGRFIFNNVPLGHHLIEVSNTGYTSIIGHIDMTGNLEMDFALQPTIVENQAVIVTGVTNATSIRKTPVPVTSIRKAEILQTPSTNIIDLLARKPGISQIGTGPGISKPIIRGLGYNRVVVINEGVRQEGQQWGDEHGIEIDELSIARAEILKGPASLIYGSDAIAGVINLITNVPVSEGTIRGNILTNYQTNNDLFGLNANIAGNKKGINWNVYGSLKSAGDYKNKYDGKVLNSRFNEKNYGAYIGVNKKWGFSHLIFSGFHQHVGLIEGDRDDATGKFILNAGTPLERIAANEDLNERETLIPSQNITHYKLVSDNNIILEKSRLKINVGYQQNQRKEFGDPENPTLAGLHFDLKTISYNLQFVLPEKKEWHTTIGVNGMYQTNENKGEEVIIPEYNLFDVGSFVYTQRFFKKLTLSGGARFDNRSIGSKDFFDGADLKFAAFKRSFSNVSGSIGVSYEPAEFLTFKANIARGFRAPNMAELGSNGAHEGTNRYEYGDNDLRSETSLQFDGGFRVDYEHFSLGIDGFYNRINDFIFYRKLESQFGGDSLVNVDGDDLMAFKYSQFDATLSGMEINLDIHPHPLDWLHFENSVSFVRGRFTERIAGTDNLPLIPPVKLVSELKANFKTTGKTLRNFYFKVEMDRYFVQNKPFFAYNTETATPAYTLLNSGIGTDIINKKSKTIFSIHLAGINLTNAAYQNHLSRLKYTAENMVTGRMGVFNPGRNFSLKINIPLEFAERKVE